MKTLISNCCAGAFFYKNVLNEDFKNPFMWSGITASDFIYLIKNFKNIDFNNFKLEESFLHGVRKFKSFKIRVNDGFDIHFPHYYEGENETKTNCDLFKKDIKKYVIEKYKHRLLKMTDEPLFIILDNKKDLSWTETEIKELEKIKNYKIILFTDKQISLNSNNIIVIHENGFSHTTCMTKYSDLIKDNLYV